MKSKTDIVTGIVTILLAGVGALSVGDIDTQTTHGGAINSASFPRYIVILLFLCGVGLVWQGFHLKALKNYWPTKNTLLKIGLFILWFCIYVGMIMGLSSIFSMSETMWIQNNTAFAISSGIYLVGAMLMLGRRRPLELILVAIGVPLGIIVSFGGFFQILLP